jgi:transcriptional regulator with XRE-family HTH domain
MRRTLKQRMNELSSTRRKRINTRAAALVSEEKTLQELRRARKLTQVRMAKALRITQDGVSRLERRTDLLLSTLRKSVEAMGGRVSLVAEFPEREPVTISGIAATEAVTQRRARRGSRASAGKG